MEVKTLLFLLADLALILSGYFYGWKFLRKGNVLLGLEWWIVAFSATSFFAYGLSGAMPFYNLSIYLDAFSRGFGFPVIAVAGAMAITHGYKPSRRVDILFFAAGFVLAYVLVAADFVEAVKPWFYLVMGTWFAIFVGYFAWRLLEAGERLHALNLLVVMATNMTIAGIYDFYTIPGDDSDKTLFYTFALATWAYLLFGFYHAYCALERSDQQRNRMSAPAFVPSSFRPYGGWLSKPQDHLQPALEEKIYADVVVVGAGFAGLNTALELAKRGAKVAVLEQEHAGFGASGRNAGYLMGSLGIEFSYFVDRVGIEKATQIVSFYDAGVTYVEKKFDEYGIDCDYNPSGHIRAGVHPSQEKKIRKDMELGLKLGSQTQFLTQADLRARGIPPAFVVGHTQQTGGTLDPGKYVTGLRHAALEAGIKLYEKSPVLSYRDGDIVTCTTARGSASAPKVVLATNAYTPQLGLLKDKVMPIRVSAIETEPLTAEQRTSLGWPRREGLITAHRTLESFRLTPRNTLLITTTRLSYVYGGKTPNIPDPVVYATLERAFRDRFPTLRGVGIRSCWSGYVSLAFDALPVVGATGRQQNILYTAGCSGHGIAGQSLLGQLLSEKIYGTQHPLLSALHHNTPRTVPEPLQWIGVNAVMGLMRMVDESVNRKARDRRAAV